MERFQKISKKVADKLSHSKAVIVAGSTGVIATASQAAAITAPDFSEPMANVGILLVAMLGFGAIVWGSRKLLSFIS